MNAPLPTVKELEKLPMRAVVAYAARTARRVSTEFRGIVADDILDNALQLLESVSMTRLIGNLDQASVLCASKRVVDAYADAPVDMRSIERFRMLFAFIEAAFTAMSAIEAAAHPSNASHQIQRASQAAQRAVRSVEVLHSEAAPAMAEAARQDYDILLRKYGEHDEVVIGEPVDCFD